jgi:hypothetical protein
MKPLADSWVDPVVEAYKAGIDRTLLVEQLRRTPEERLRRIEELQHALLELAAAGRRAKR